MPSKWFFGLATSLVLLIPADSRLKSPAAAQESAPPANVDASRMINAILLGTHQQND